ncbi:MAG: hypothetical protein WBX25_32495 [Rhodomicrobium sp.]
MGLSDKLARDRLDARRNYSASLMSNTKWRALFQAIEDAGVEIRQITIKFVGIDDEKPIRWVSPNRISRFLDTLEFGPVPLVGIEWLEFPNLATFPHHKNVRAAVFRQDTGAVRAAIESLGKHYPLEERDPMVCESSVTFGNGSHPCPALTDRHY